MARAIVGCYEDFGFGRHLKWEPQRGGAGGSVQAPSQVLTGSLGLEENVRRAGSIVDRRQWQLGPGRLWRRGKNRF